MAVACETIQEFGYPGTRVLEQSIASAFFFDIIATGLAGTTKVGRMRREHYQSIHDTKGRLAASKHYCERLNGRGGDSGIMQQSNSTLVANTALKDCISCISGPKLLAHV